MGGKLGALLAVSLASGYTIAVAGDWLSHGGDPQASGWQRHGKTLTVANIKNLKLLWKRQLEAPSAAPDSLSAPVILGPTITHRGVRELVFVAGGGDQLYAFDADLGTLFWKRHFDVHSKAPCGSVMAATPVIEPDPNEDMSEPVTDDEDDDEAGPMRPLYSVASDGRLHAIRVSDGNDLSAPINFLPPDAKYSNLNLWSGTVYAGTWDHCNGAPDGFWSIRVNTPYVKSKFYSAKGAYRAAISPSGVVYGAIAGGIVSLQPGSLQLKQFSKIGAGASTVIKYEGRECVVAEAPSGRLLLLDAGDLTLVAEYHDPRHAFVGLASWQDPQGVRWIYATTQQNVMAFKLTGRSTALKLERAWTSSDMFIPGPPAVTHGIVLLLSGAGLRALDAATGKDLYSSPPIESITDSSEIAVANGHICFVTSDNTLYCFGIPLER